MAGPRAQSTSCRAAWLAPAAVTPVALIRIGHRSPMVVQRPWRAMFDLQAFRFHRVKMGPRHRWLVGSGLTAVAISGLRRQRRVVGLAAMGPVGDGDDIRTALASLCIVAGTYRHLGNCARRSPAAAPDRSAVVYRSQFAPWRGARCRAAQHGSAPPHSPARAVEHDAERSPSWVGAGSGCPAGPRNSPKFQNCSAQPLAANVR